VIITLPKLHQLQREIYEHPARWKVLACGRRWGKTRLAGIAALTAAMRGQRVWWLAPTYATSGIGFRQLKQLVQDVPDVRIRDGDRMVQLPLMGGEVWFKSADSGDSGLRGEGLDLAIFDEAAYCPEAVWQQAIRPALADRRGKGIFISTPAGDGDWFHRAWQQSGSNGWQSWQLPSWTNPHLDAAEVEAARAELPSIVFRQEFGAEFVASSGTRVRREWLRTGRPTEAELERSRILMGVDLAISTKDGADYTAAVVLAKHADGRTWVRDAARVRAGFQDVLAFIRAMAAKHGPQAISVEQVQYQAAVVSELLRTTDLPVKGVRPDRDKVTRFQPVEARLEQGMIMLDPALPDYFQQELLAFPLGEHDDLVDAMTYAWGSGARVLEWS